MKPKRVLVVGCAVSQQRITRMLPECQILSYGDGVVLDDVDPDAVVLCCDGLVEEHFEIALRYRLYSFPIYLLSDSSPQRANQIVAVLGWSIRLRSIQAWELREELFPGDKQQRATNTLF